MRHHVGMGLQFLVLTLLPLLIIWQLEFGFRLIYMPAFLVLGLLVFSIGTRLRES